MAVRRKRQYDGNPDFDYPGILFSMIELIDKAIANEREACARIADEHAAGVPSSSGQLCAAKIATKIRARNK